MYDVVAIGEMLIDFTATAEQPDGYPILAAHPGGAPANFLAPLSKYGRSVSLISSVGADAFGKMLIKTAADGGIDTKHITVTDAAFTTLAFVTLDKKGERTFSFARKPGADTLLSPDTVDYALLDSTRVLHFGTVGMTNEPGRSAHIAAVKYAKQKGKLISFDPNLREPLWSDLAEAREQMLWGLSMADIIKISDNEVKFLFDLDPEAGAEHIFTHFGPKLVYVTCGPEGCVYKNRNGAGFAPAPDGIKPVDTTGAGDIFGGSAMYALLTLDKAPEALTTEEMHRCALFACKTASLSTLSLGGISSVPELQTL